MRCALLHVKASNNIVDYFFNIAVARESDKLKNIYCCGTLMVLLIEFNLYLWEFIK